MSENFVIKINDLINHHNGFISEISIEKIQTPKRLEIIEKEFKPIETLVYVLPKPENTNFKPIAAKKRKTFDSNAEDSLLGKELDRTRVESSRSE